MLSTKSMAKTSERFKNFNAKRRFKVRIALRSFASFQYGDDGIVAN